MSTMTTRTSRRAWSGRFVVAAAGMALIASSCGSSEATPATDPAASIDTTTTTTTTSVAGEGTEAPSTEPPALTLDEYLVAIINANADAGACGMKAEEDFNNAPAPDQEPTEAEAVEGGKEYFAGQLGCQQSAIDAIAALRPPPEAVAAHTDLVAARRAHLAASRAEIDAAVTMDEITRAVVEPDPAVIEAFGNWSDACLALEDVATSNGIDATLDCPVPPTNQEPVQVTVFIDGDEWLVEPSGIIQDNGAGIAINVENRDDAVHQVMQVDIFSGSPSELPIVDGVLDTGRCNVSSDGEDPTPPPAYFGCPWLTGEGATVVFHELEPGDSVNLEGGAGPATIVVLDYLTGAYEAGRYVAVLVAPFE
jgi:hypothetical protein